MALATLLGEIICTATGCGHDLSQQKPGSLGVGMAPSSRALIARVQEPYVPDRSQTNGHADIEVLPSPKPRLNGKRRTPLPIDVKTLQARYCSSTEKTL